MKVTLVGIPVLDQDKALQFYTEILDFDVKKNQTLEGGNKWITLISKEDPKGPEILLEPSPLHFATSKAYQDALFEAGIPYTQLEVVDVDVEYDRLVNLGVEFSVKPTVYETTKYAIFNDTCGNYIQIVEPM